MIGRSGVIEGHLAACGCETYTCKGGHGRAKESAWLPVGARHMHAGGTMEGQWRAPGCLWGPDTRMQGGPWKGRRGAPGCRWGQCVAAQQGSEQSWLPANTHAHTCIVMFRASPWHALLARPPTAHPPHTHPLPPTTLRRRGCGKQSRSSSADGSMMVVMDLTIVDLAGRVHDGQAVHEVQGHGSHLLHAREHEVNKDAHRLVHAVARDEHVGAQLRAGCARIMHACVCVCMHVCVCMRVCARACVYLFVVMVESHTNLVGCHNAHKGVPIV